MLNNLFSRKLFFCQLIRKLILNDKRQTKKNCKILCYTFSLSHLKMLEEKTRIGEVTWEKEVDFSALLKHEEEAASHFSRYHSLSLSDTHYRFLERREREIIQQFHYKIPSSSEAKVSYSSSAISLLAPSPKIVSFFFFFF